MRTSHLLLRGTCVLMLTSHSRGLLRQLTSSGRLIRSCADQLCMTENRFHLGVNLEYGDTSKARDWAGHKKNVLQINNDNECVLSMLYNNLEAEKRALVAPYVAGMRLGGGAPRPGAAVASGPGYWDDGLLGHMRFTGDFHQLAVTPHLSYVLPFLSNEFSVSLALPIMHAEIDDVHRVDLTSTSPYDVTVGNVYRRNATDNIAFLAKTVAGLDIGNWSHSGVGDLTLKLSWDRSFDQKKADIDPIDLHVFVALMFPTGCEKDEDRAFSLAFGSDGAWSIPFGIALDALAWERLKFGAAVQFETIFDHSRVRRLKTHIHQTDFLLVNKGRATKDYGISWTFHTYLQAWKLWEGLSLRASYEYFKHDADHLHARDARFTDAIINSARNLGSSHVHQFIFDAHYQFDIKCCSPELSLFYKWPVSGERIIAPHTFGGQLCVSF